MAEKKTTAPKAEKPEMKLDELAGEITKFVKDAVYVGVGFGVLAVQKLQTQRHDLTQALNRRMDSGKSEWEKMGERFEAQMKSVEDRLDQVEERIDEMLDKAQEQLPEQVGELLGKARQAVKDAREQVLELVRREEKTAA